MNRPSESLQSRSTADSLALETSFLHANAYLAFAGWGWRTTFPDPEKFCFVHFKWFNYSLLLGGLGVWNAWKTFRPLGNPLSSWSPRLPKHQTISALLTSDLPGTGKEWWTTLIWGAFLAFGATIFLCCWAYIWFWDSAGAGGFSGWGFVACWQQKLCVSSTPWAGLVKWYSLSLPVEG